MDDNKRPYNKLSYVPFFKIKINDEFWATRQKINREVSVPLQLEKLEEDHHIDNFRVAAGVKKGTHLGEFYFDSDLYKWLEAAFYILHTYEDINLEKKVNEIVNLIVKAQLKDGYVNTFYSPRFKEKRFTNFPFMHELYCAGHLIQAAIAQNQAKGSKELLKVAENFASFIAKIFRNKKDNEVPGHEEIEMALIELFRITKKREYLLLSRDLINKRGRISGLKAYIIRKYLNFNHILKAAKKFNAIFKQKNSDLYYNKRGEEDEVADFYSDLTLSERIKFIFSILTGKSFQLNIPVKEIIDPEGHAVRAMYLFCGMADLYSETGDQLLLNVLKRIWLKIVKGKMYISGGIGSIKGIEGFEKDFKLRNENSYSETCAAIGFLMWTWRLLQITGHCKYSDLIERLLYNAMLVGYSIDGRKYFYSNPLISNRQAERKEWFLCACCPPNVARTIASLGNYIYSISEKGIWIHQYIGNATDVRFNSNIIKIELISNFPWNGNVKIKLGLDRNRNFSTFFRVPQWSISTTLSVNGKKHYNSLTPGKYVEIIRNWIDKDEIDINFEMVPRLLESDPRIKSNREKGALSYGPLIYCLEQKDNKNFDIFSMKIPKNQDFEISYEPNLLDGIIIIRGNISNGEKFMAIPYYAWNNRGSTKMQVWNKII
ncbi:MAG: glycoside hydrolase family 127 protein [Candidatus Odinarchaeota archaeon]